MRPVLLYIAAASAFPLALALLFLGFAIPGQQSQISAARLDYVGKNGTSLLDAADEKLARGKPGPAHFLALASKDEASEQLLKAIETRYAEDATLQVAGGRDPYFSELTQLLDPTEIALFTGRGAAGLIVSQKARGALSQMMSFSENLWVQQILEGRDITGLPHLPPADSPSGAPMEAALLISALLTQSEAMSTAMSRELTGWIAQARSKEIAIFPVLDRALLDVLGLSQRMDWETLRTVFSQAESWENISWLNAALRAGEEQTAPPEVILSAWISVESTEALNSYVNTFSETGWTDVEQSITAGLSALTTLIEENRPIYRAPEWTHGLFPEAVTSIEQLTISWTQGNATYLMIARFASFGLAGLIVSGALISFFNGSQELDVLPSKAVLASGTTAAIFCLVSWALTEPTLLQSSQSRTPEISFNAGPGALMGSLKAAAMNPGPIDQVTLLVLGVFLLVQIIIYLVCLVRVSDINKQPVSPALKIALLENEDSLFDTGLYVGLGGTVLSLILVTLGIVDASIMAAYASTLFGIIFVAALKIFHVRPLRRSLIIENERPL